MTNLDSLKRAYGWLEHQLWGASKHPKQHEPSPDRYGDARTFEESFDPAPEHISPLSPMEDHVRTTFQTDEMVDADSSATEVRPVKRIRETTTQLSREPCSPEEGTNIAPYLESKDAGLVAVRQHGVEVYALLITSELVDLLQRNILTFNNTKSLDKQVRNLADALESTRNELVRVKQRLADLLKMGRELELDEGFESSGDIHSLKCQEEALQQSILELEDALSSYQQEQFSASFAKRAHEHALYNLLQPPLQQAGLLSATETPSIAPAVDSIPIRLDSDNGKGSDPGFILPVQGSEPSQTPSEFERMSMRVAIEEKFNEVQEYRYKLDIFHDIYHQNMGEFNENVANGVEKHSREEFDQFHFNLKAEITRRLIKTEEELRTLKLQARDAGIEHTFDEESIFQSDVDDGYAESLEDDMIRTAPTSKIRSWLNEIPIEADETAEVDGMTILEFDDWDTRSVGIGDSISCVGDGSMARKIRRWEDMKQIVL
ncbi:MAG: hypothetical protein M1822_008446 [Bathelium mastoideum]|nr:MAG: hypothetical protein M1822_008446 [Bathelium mastoideum]